jgi:hypothetical protein
MHGQRYRFYVWQHLYNVSMDEKFDDALIGRVLFKHPGILERAHSAVDDAVTIEWDSLSVAFTRGNLDDIEQTFYRLLLQIYFRGYLDRLFDEQGWPGNRQP